MKKVFILLSVPLLVCLTNIRASAQAQELEQLALDIEKLSQMKSILSEMYKGYQILSGGYNTIKGIAQGNFSLHNAFLSSLLSVSPTVKNYVRIADIIAAQTQLMSEYKTAYKNFSASGAFTAGELSYISSVYANLFGKSLDNLSELAMILTDDNLRMSDAERLSAIDHIYDDMQDKLSFLRSFDGKAGILGNERQHEIQSNNILQSLYGQ